MVFARRAARRRRPGRSRDRAEYRAESRLRTIVALAGLGPCLVNAVITGSRGEFVARTDLELPGLGVILEYQGDYHRAREQWRADMTRRSRIEAVTGCRVLELNADDLADPLDLVARILRLARIARPDAELPRMATAWARPLAIRGDSTRKRAG